jgi:Protein of unknown function (DUF1566)
MSFTNRPFVVRLSGLLAVTFVCAAAPVRANAPAGRYTSPATGTVLDTRTRLTWQQKSSPAVTLGAAGSACFNLVLPGTGWRLPTVKELLTLADTARDNGLDSTAFPSEPLGAYWSGTPVAGRPSDGWFATFGAANNSNGTDEGAALHLVRCVR